MKKLFLIASIVLVLMSLVSVLQAGTAEYIGDVNGHVATISADGRYVAYQDFAVFDYRPGVRVMGTGARTFIKDRQTGETREIYPGVVGDTTIPAIELPHITGDGNHLVFYSSRLGIDPVERTEMCGVFIRNLSTDETAVASLGAVACYIHRPVAVSDDGRYIAYNGYHQTYPHVDYPTYPYVDYSIYFQDLQAGTRERLDPPLKNNMDYGYAGNYFGSVVSMSKEGRYVAFNYIMLENRQNGTRLDSSIYIRDRVTGRIKEENGTDFPLFGPLLDSDGNYYVYSMMNKSSQEEYIVRDAQTGQKEALGISTFPSISGDGRYLAWDYSGGVTLYDRTANTTGTVVADGHAPWISANGRFILYRTYEPGPLGSIAEKLYVYDKGF